MPGLSHPQSPIEVLHIASGDRWAGAEVQLWTLVRHLNRREDTRARVVLLNEGETAERLREAGVAVDILDESRLNGFQILLGLRRLIRLHRPDVIHTHRQKENILGSLANATTLRVPCVRTVHGAPEHAPPWSRPHKRIFRWLNWVAGRYIQTRIIAVTDELGRQLGREFPPNHVIAIENGVDVEAISGAHDLGPADFRTALPQHRHIGIVGRLEPVKRIDIFLDMAADLLAGTPPSPLAFHVFGDGSELEHITEVREAPSDRSLRNVSRAPNGHPHLHREPGYPNHVFRP
jgi:L-malate glycosyltransferase